MVIKSMIFAGVALVTAVPIANAQSNAEAQQAAPALMSYAANAPAYAMAGGGTSSRDVSDAPAPARATKDAVRAQVMGELRQTVHDSELVGLHDLYAHP